MANGVTGGASGAEWGQKVDAFLESSMQGKSGSRFVYIKNEGEVEIFNNPLEAKKLGFRPIPLRDLYEMSMKSLSTAEPGSMHERLVTRLSDPVVQSRYQTLFDLAVKPATQWIVMSHEMAETLDRQLDQVTAFQVSAKGKMSGVYFIQLSTDEKPLAIKFDKEGWGQFVADGYFKALEFPVANYSMVGRDTPLGQKLFQQLSSGVVEVHFTDLGSQSKRFMEQIRYPMVIVMEMLEGRSLESMHADDIPRLLTSEKFTQKLGEIIFFDTVIGNFDRLSSRICNLGNILVHNDEISLIDHNYRLETLEDFEKVKKNLVALWDRQSGEVEAIVDRLLSNLTMKKIPISEIGRDALIAQIREGIAQGRERFLTTFGNAETVDSIFKVPSGNKPLFDQIYEIIAGELK